MIKSMPLNEFLFEYTERNIDNKYRPVAVGRYGIRSRDSIYSKELAKDYSKNKLIFKNTLTIGMGSVQIDIGILSTDETYSVSPAYHTYRINNINPNYLRYCLECRNQDMFVRYVKKGSRQGKTIDLSRWLTYEIPVYSIEDQEKIVDKIDRVQGIIDASEKQLVKLDELVKSRFVEMFGDPEDSTAKWNRTNFASVCLDMHQGINTVADKIEYVDSGFPILQSKNITSGFLNLEDVRYVKESDYEYYRNKYNPQPNDLLVCNIGTIGKSLIVENEMEFLIAWNLFLIKLNKELVNPIFIKVFIELLNQQNYFEKYMTGGTVKFVNKKTIGNISTPLPPLELQEQFSAFVAEVDKSKLAVKQSLEKLETLKKSLMQQYFG